MRNKQKYFLLGFLLIIGIGLTNSMDCRANQIDDTRVSYKATVVPGEPDWYSEVPSVLPFTTENRELLAPVKITVPAGQEESENTQVVVTVRSSNGYQLENGLGDSLAYQLVKEDNQALLGTKKEQLLGELPLEDGTIHSKACLIDDANKTGKYVDTLCYSFSLSTNEEP